MDSLAKDLQKYVDLNLYIFPLRTRGKAPITKDITYKHASNDPRQLHEWWSAHPLANVGLQPALSGLVILDVDVKNGGLDSLARLERAHGPIQTTCVGTGSGGKHFYFSHSGDDITNSIGVWPGIDIIYDKNHVVAPPSIHPNGQPYVWEREGTIEPAPPWLLALAAKQAPVNTSGISQGVSSEGVKGRLAKSTQEFLATGAPSGKWNNILFKAAKDSQQNGYTKEWFIGEATLITGSLDETDLGTIESAFSTEPKHGPRLKQHEDWRQIISRCHLIQNVSDIEQRRFVDLTDGLVRLDLDPRLIELVFDRTEREKYLKDKAVLAKFEYQPHKMAPLIKSGPDHIYNYYSPPTWLMGHFFRQEKLEGGPIPKLYEEFFRHLTGGHDESYEYLLDWLATSLQGRNFTILTAIGEEGIGKGVLASIMRGLHGDDNFTTVMDSVFKSKFNSQLANKTLVYVDEIDLTTKESQDRLKTVVNEDLVIEAKGVDAKVARNHANFYISSNHMDAIKVSNEDRRFSVIQLTDTKLVNSAFVGRVDELLNENSLGTLARGLRFRGVARSMLIPFRSKRFAAIMEAGLADWELYVLQELAEKYRGGRPLLSEIQDIVMADENMRYKPGRRRFERLADKYPEVLRIKQLTYGSTIRCIEFIAPLGSAGQKAS